jgi:transcriptional regulator with XRE-family HTH domain
LAGAPRNDNFACRIGKDEGMIDDDLSEVLTSVGPRLKSLRREKGVTLDQLSQLTGISPSTLSRLESGQRKPTLELLLPLAKAHQVQLDELVGAPATGDPRVHLRPFTRYGQTIVPLTRHLGGLHAYKHILPAAKGEARRPELGTHEGYEWLYVMSGKLRLILGEHDLTLTAGEAAEFDTRTPHGFANAGTRPVEFLSLYGAQGERIHVRARPTARKDP